MTGGEIDAAIRVESLAFDIASGRLLDDADPRAHSTFCNLRFCECTARVADANGLSAADVSAILRDAIDTGDDAAWRALSQGV